MGWSDGDFLRMSRMACCGMIRDGVFFILTKVRNSVHIAHRSPQLLQCQKISLRFCKMQETFCHKKRFLGVPLHPDSHF
jgi:hypothetical protein